MAARRLLIVLLVLLGISAALAVLAPQRDGGGEPETTAPRKDQPALPGSGEGAHYEVQINADTEKIDAVGTGEVPLRVGDQVALAVRSRRSDQVEIPAFGLIEAVSRDGPASFDLLLERPGAFAVRLVHEGRTVGRLYVTGRAPREPVPAP